MNPQEFIFIVIKKQVSLIDPADKTYKPAFVFEGWKEVPPVTSLFATTPQGDEHFLYYHPGAEVEKVAFALISIFALYAHLDEVFRAEQMSCYELTWHTTEEKS